MGRAASWVRRPKEWAEVERSGESALSLGDPDIQRVRGGRGTISELYGRQEDAASSGDRERVFKESKVSIKCCLIPAR